MYMYKVTLMSWSVLASQGVGNQLDSLRCCSGMTGAITRLHSGLAGLALAVHFLLIHWRWIFFRAGGTASL